MNNKIILTFFLFFFFSISVNSTSIVSFSNMNYTSYNIEVYDSNGNPYTTSLTEQPITLNSTSDYIVYIKPVIEKINMTNAPTYIKDRLSFVSDILYLTLMVALIIGFFYGVKVLAIG